MATPKQFLVFNIEVCFDIDKDLAHNIQSTLDDCRGLAAARVVGTRILNSEKEYDDWYKSPERIQEVEIPVATTMKIDWD